MSLIRFSYSDNPINDLNNKIRHIYDIHFLLKDKSINEFFNSNEFEKMMLKVGNDDIFSFKTNNEWLKLHPKSALIFDKPEFTWNKLKNTYKGTFKELVYGELPDENKILKTIKNVSDKLKVIKWNIK